LIGDEHVSWLTVIVGSSHVGEEIFDLLTDDHVGDVVDSIADNVVTSTDGYGGCTGFDINDIITDSLFSHGRLTKSHSLTFKVGRSIEDNVGSGVIALFVPVWSK
jgi:hypothetical protein